MTTSTRLPSALRRLWSEWQGRTAADALEREGGETQAAGAQDYGETEEPEGQEGGETPGAAAQDGGGAEEPEGQEGGETPGAAAQDGGGAEEPEGQEGGETPGAAAQGGGGAEAPESQAGGVGWRPTEPGHAEAGPPVGNDEPTLEMPQVHPRMRERWIVARRQEGLRRLRFVLIGVVVVCLLGVAIGVLESPLTGIQHLKLTGNVHEPSSEVRRVAGLGSGTPLLSIDPGAVEARLGRLPWVQAAKVRRSWPTTVSVHVTERVPVGLVGTGSPGSLALVDRTGRVLGDVAPTSAPSLPALASLGPAGRPGTWLAGTGGAHTEETSPGSGFVTSPNALLELAAQLPPSLDPVVRTVTVAPASLGGGLAMTITPAGTAMTPASSRAAPIPVLFGDASALPAKLLALQTIVEQVNLRGVTVVDVSVPNRPVLEGS